MGTAGEEGVTIQYKYHESRCKCLVQVWGPGQPESGGHGWGGGRRLLPRHSRYARGNTNTQPGNILIFMEVFNLSLPIFFIHAIFLS